jgi:Na+/proline symporter
LYAAVTAYLAFRGWQKTRSVESFAVGSGDISPVVIGLSLAAQITSVATFVANPGLVFAFGISGLLGFGLAAAGGITVGLIFFSSAFRRIGAQNTALTVPQWIGARFRSKPLSLGFAVVSLALVAFAVLIVVVLSHTLGALLGLPPSWVALGVILFVFTYVLLGGVNTHAYTNAIQASIMLVVAFLLIGKGLPSVWEGEGLFAQLSAQDPVLVQITNPKSLYFRNLFEVFFCNAIIGLALVCQPHILSKALYLKSDRDVRKYLVTAIIVGTVFASVMWVGLFARLDLPATTAWDKVVPTWVVTQFSGPVSVLITIGILAAGISTLEGVLLALSAIFSIDLYMGGLGGTKALAGLSAEEKGRRALWVGRLGIVALGVVTYALSLSQLNDPTGGSVAIFAMYGVYMVIAVSFLPLFAGMFLERSHTGSVIAGSVTAFVAYLFTCFVPWSTMANNPAFIGTIAIGAAAVVFGVAELVVYLRAAGAADPPVAERPNGGIV